jgi:FkbM family methyltransferase
MKNYFLDCGSHFGEGLNHFMQHYKMDETWEIYSFEPNKDSYFILSNKKFNINVKFFNKGVHTENCILKFRPETTSVSYGQRPDGAGSTFLSKDDWDITINNPGAGTFKNDEYEIECIDLDEFIKNLKDINFLVVKLDVEGSEYAILRKLIETGNIKKINDLYVEFHDWAMKSETLTSTNDLIQKIQNLGININRWF